MKRSRKREAGSGKLEAGSWKHATRKGTSYDHTITHTTRPRYRPPWPDSACSRRSRVVYHCHSGYAGNKSSFLGGRGGEIAAPQVFPGSVPIGTPLPGQEGAQPRRQATRPGGTGGGTPHPIAIHALSTISISTRIDVIHVIHSRAQGDIPPSPLVPPDYAHVPPYCALHSSGRLSCR